MTSYTGVTGVNEGYDAILVSNDETGSLTLFSLASTLDIPGCTDSCACNYNSNATLNDGSCEFSSCGGCTHVEALNYDASATLEDGSCTFEDDCPGDFDNDNSVTTADLLSFLDVLWHRMPVMGKVEQTLRAVEPCPCNPRLSPSSKFFVPYGGL